MPRGMKRIDDDDDVNINNEESFESISPAFDWQSVQSRRCGPQYKLQQEYFYEQ